MARSTPELRSQQIEGSWWSLFRSEAIDAVVAQAVEHNRTLEASTATLRQSRDLAQWPPKAPAILRSALPLELAAKNTVRNYSAAPSTCRRSLILRWVPPSATRLTTMAASNAWHRRAACHRRGDSASIGCGLFVHHRTGGDADPGHRFGESADHHHRNHPAAG